MSILAAPAERECRIYWLVSLCLHLFVGMKRYPIRAMTNDSLSFHQKEKVEFIN